MKICALCGRELKGIKQKHHVLPKSLNGKEIIKMHAICHKIIHLNFTHGQLAVYTMENIKSVDEIKMFIEWIKDKPYDFLSKNNK